MIDYLDAALFRLLCEHLFLIVPCVLEPDTGAVREGVPREVPGAFGPHGYAPAIPVFYPIIGLLQESNGKRTIRKASHLASEVFGKNGFHVLAVNLRDIAKEMVISGCPTTAPFGIGLLSHDDANALFSRMDGRHKAGYTSTYNQDIRLDGFLFHFDHAVSSSLGIFTGNRGLVLVRVSITFWHSRPIFWPYPPPADPSSL